MPHYISSTSIKHLPGVEFLGEAKLDREDCHLTWKERLPSGEIVENGVCVPKGYDAEVNKYVSCVWMQKETREAYEKANNVKINNTVLPSKKSRVKVVSVVPDPRQFQLFA